MKPKERMAIPRQQPKELPVAEDGFDRVPHESGFAANAPDVRSIFRCVGPDLARHEPCGWEL